MRTGYAAVFLSLLAGAGALQLAPALPVRHAVSKRPVAVRAAIDPFSHPTFGALATGASEGAVAAQNTGGFQPSSLFTGLVFYSVGMILLTWWDTVVPQTDDKNSARLFRKVFGKKDDDAPEEGAAANALADGTNLPPLASLSDACHMLEHADGAYLYLCKAGSAAQCKIGFTECKVSDDLSDHYGEPVLMCTLPDQKIR